MPRRLNLEGQRFGRLLVLSEVGRTKHGNILWLCRCDCGMEKNYDTGVLRIGDAVSCGCYHTERQRECLRTHGKKGKRIYNVWCGMIQRCTNPNNPSFKNYGGRGITVCPEWMDFESFYGDMGDPPEDLTIDRIDVNKGYYKENCRWASSAVQSRNKRVNRLLTYQGKTLTLIDWSVEIGIDYYTLHSRLRRGWDTERILTTRVEVE